ncbi:putative purine permease, plant [Helianthus annuus]|nr:putative purine permease, plant [Helianthus annuus]
MSHWLHLDDLLVNVGWVWLLQAAYWIVSHWLCIRVCNGWDWVILIWPKLTNLNTINMLHKWRDQKSAAVILHNMWPLLVKAHFWVFGADYPPLKPGMYSHYTDHDIDNVQVVGSTLHGLIFALPELVFINLLEGRLFHVMLEQQVAVSFAFVFTTIGVIVNDDFHGMSAEAKSFIGRESAYNMVIIWGVITFQLGVLGSTAVLYLSSTVLAGVLNSIRVPLTSIAAVILLNDPMSGFKILSLIVTFWGFVCYIYAFGLFNQLDILFCPGCYHLCWLC